MEIFSPGHSKLRESVSTLKLCEIRAFVSYVHSADQAEIRCAPEADATFSLISFSLKLIHPLGFYDDLIFWRNI